MFHHCSPRHNTLMHNEPKVLAMCVSPARGFTGDKALNDILTKNGTETIWKSQSERASSPYNYQVCELTDLECQQNNFVPHGMSSTVESRMLYETSGNLMEANYRGRRVAQQSYCCTDCWKCSGLFREQAKLLVPYVREKKDDFIWSIQLISMPITSQTQG